jgi:deoxyadenosine/deoxycytidine kinase
VNLFDHGPIYMLTAFIVLNPAIANNKYFRKWWEKTLQHWSSTLDMIIWLDASNSVLSQRVNLRDSWHRVKDKSEKEIFNFLSLFRASFNQVMSLSKTYNKNLITLHFDTDKLTPDQLTRKFLHSYGKNFQNI